MADLTVIGHVAIDRIVSRNGERVQLGGPPSYIAIASQILGVDIRVITKVGDDLPEYIREELGRLGVEIDRFVVKGAQTTRFVLDYTGRARSMWVESVCEEISPEDIEVPAEAVIVAPIVGEISTETISSLNSEFMALDPQGFLREIDVDGKVSLHPWNDRDLISRLDVLKASSREMRRITGEFRTQDGLKGILETGAGIAIATHGSRGSEIAFERGFYAIPAYPSVVQGATGAGDAFLGAFVAELLEGEDPLWCASIGAAVSSCVVETHGTSIWRSKRVIENRAQEIFEGIARL